VPGGAESVCADWILIPTIIARGTPHSVPILRVSLSHVIIAFGRLVGRHTGVATLRRATLASDWPVSTPDSDPLVENPRSVP
jgi:hypothetical protein